MVGSARESQPGSGDPGVRPRIEIFRDLGLTGRTSELLDDGYATRSQNSVARRARYRRIPEAGNFATEIGSLLRRNAYGWPSSFRFRTPGVPELAPRTLAISLPYSSLERDFCRRRQTRKKAA
jgi:hypothetical protein